MNSFGFGGANGHVLLRSHDKLKNFNGHNNVNDSPRLVCVSGRTEEAVTELLNELHAKSADEEFHALLGHVFRSVSIYLIDGWNVVLI